MIELTGASHCSIISVIQLIIAPTTKTYHNGHKIPLRVIIVATCAVCPAHGFGHHPVYKERGSNNGKYNRRPVTEIECILNRCLSLLTRTKKVPKIENTIPRPAITIGRRIGASPLKLSFDLISAPVPSLQRIVANKSQKDRHPYRPHHLHYPQRCRQLWRIPNIIFGDTCFNFTYCVSANIGSFLV